MMTLTIGAGASISLAENSAEAIADRAVLADNIVEE
jgi:hypothetical protein